MEHRKLGATGISVSPLCLGAMMFGAWGNTDHDDSIRDHPRRARRRHQLHRHRRRLLARRVGGDRRQGAEGRRAATRSCSPRRRTAACTTRDPNQFGNSRRWLVKEVEGSLKRLKTDWIDLYQIHRPEPDTDIDQTLGALSDLIAAGKVRAIGSSTFPAWQIVEAQWARRAARARALRLRAAAVLDADPRDRARRASGLRAVRHGRDPVEPARRRLALGALHQRRRLAGARAGARR